MNQPTEDIESYSTTASNTTECSLNEKNTCHICKIVFKNLISGPSVHAEEK